MDNMWIYEQGRSVPVEAQKAFSNGSFSGTDINPMWRIKKLTELFGPAGIGWYYEVLSERAETYGETVMAIVDINLYVKVDGEWSKPIYGTGGNQLVQVFKSGAKPSDEGYKKALTDALSIACKALGIGADIWYSRDPSAVDPTSKYAEKYTQPAQPAPATVKAAPAQVPKETAPAVATTSAAVPQDGADVLAIRKGELMQWGAAHKMSMVQVGDCIKSLMDGGAVPSGNWRTMKDHEYKAMMAALDATFGGAA